MNGKFITIPDAVCFDNELPPMARLLYVVIARLAAKEGYCWATNSFLAKQLGVRSETISRALKYLETRRYVRLYFEGAGNEVRRIYTFDENVKGFDENVIPPCEKSQGTLDKKVKQNNTREKDKESICLFDRFWQAYPRHQNKANAKKVFNKLNPDQATLDRMLQALAWQTAQPDWTKDNGQYIPLASTYLNGRRWEDEPPPHIEKRSPSIPRLRTEIDEHGNEVIYVV